MRFVWSPCQRVAFWLSVRPSQTASCINRQLVLVTSSYVAAHQQRPLRCWTAHRLHPLSVEHTHYALIYTQRKRIREDNSIFG